MSNSKPSPQTYKHGDPKLYLCPTCPSLPASPAFFLLNSSSAIFRSLGLTSLLLLLRSFCLYLLMRTRLHYKVFIFRNAFETELCKVRTRQNADNGRTHNCLCRNHITVCVAPCMCTVKQVKFLLQTMSTALLPDSDASIL